MKLSTGASGIIAGAMGGLLFLTFWLFISIGLVPSLIAAALGFGISLVFFRSQSPEKNMIDPSQEVLVREIIASGSRQQAEMQKIARELNGGSVRRSLEMLAELAGKIVDNVRQDPKDAKPASRFLDYYADTGIRIATIYRDLAKRGIDGPELDNLGLKVQRNLDVLSKAFRLQLSKLQEDNLMDLDTELSVLQQTLHLEGLTETTHPTKPSPQSQA